MDGWIIPMIAGLVLDCIGAFFIVRPLLQFYKERTDDLKLELDHIVNERDEIYDEGDVDFWKKNYPDVAEDIIEQDHKEAIEHRKNRVWEKESIIEKKIKHEILSNKSTKFGLVLLFIGFFLQILANSIQWMNEISV